MTGLQGAIPQLRSKRRIEQLTFAVHKHKILGMIHINDIPIKSMMFPIRFPFSIVNIPLHPHDSHHVRPWAEGAHTDPVGREEHKYIQHRFD